MLHYEKFKKDFKNSLEELFLKMDMEQIKIVISQEFDVYTSIKEDVFLLIEEVTDGRKETVLFLEPLWEAYRISEDLDSVTLGCFHNVMDIQDESNVNFSNLESYEKVKENIYFKLLNQKSKLEESAVIFPFFDLKISIYVRLDLMRVSVNQAMLHSWGKSSEEVFQDALLNTQLKNPALFLNIDMTQEKQIEIENGDSTSLHPLGQVLFNLIDFNKNNRPGSYDFDEIKLLTSGSKSLYYGSSALLYPNLLLRFAKNNDKNLIIFPIDENCLLLFPIKTTKEETEKVLSFQVLERCLFVLNETKMKKGITVFSGCLFFYDLKTQDLLKMEGGY